MIDIRTTILPEGMTTMDSAKIVQTTWNDLEIQSLVEEAIAKKTTKIGPSYMKIGPYNGHSPELRLLADRKIKVAVEMNLIPRAAVCSVCGEVNGRIDYHNEDYTRPLQTVAICQKCHMCLHNRFRSPGYALSWKRKIEEFGDGTKWFEFV